MVHIVQCFCQEWGGHKFRLEILFFSFMPVVSCLNSPALQNITKLISHMDPNFLTDTLIKPSLKVKQNFSCSSREGGSTEEVFALTTREGVSGLHSSLGLHWCY